MGKKTVLGLSVLIFLLISFFTYNWYKFNAFETNGVFGCKYIEKSLWFPWWKEWTKCVYIDNYSNNIPRDISKLKKTVSLRVWEPNSITEIPEEIGDLKELKWLAINKSNIKQLPSTFGQLSKLKNLFLRGNKINKFPKEIIGLKKLKELDLAENEIDEIPESISDLTYLETLDLSCNKIVEMPISLTNLKQLKKLDLSNNPITVLQIEKIRKGLPGTEVIFNQEETCKTNN